MGINCFYELLIKSEFRSYAINNFPQKIKIHALQEMDPIFYSKRLNLYVELNGRSYCVRYLNGDDELSIGGFYTYC